MSFQTTRALHTLGEEREPGRLQGLQVPAHGSEVLREVGGQRVRQRLERRPVRGGLQMAEEMPLAGDLVIAWHESSSGSSSRVSLQFQENTQIVPVFRTVRGTLHDDQVV